MERVLSNFLPSFLIKMLVLSLLCIGGGAALWLLVPAVHGQTAAVLLCECALLVYAAFAMLWVFFTYTHSAQLALRMSIPRKVWFGAMQLAKLMLCLLVCALCAGLCGVLAVAGGAGAAYTMDTWCMAFAMLLALASFGEVLGALAVRGTVGAVFSRVVLALLLGTVVGTAAGVVAKDAVPALSGKLTALLALNPLVLGIVLAVALLLSLCSLILVSGTKIWE